MERSRAIGDHSLKACPTSIIIISNDYYGNKIISLTDEIDGILVYISRIKVKEELYAENQVLEAKKIQTGFTSFHVSGVYSESDLEKSHQALIRINIELQQVRLDHSAKSIELAEKKTASAGL